MLSKPALFITIVYFFVGFFALFVNVIYTNSDVFLGSTQWINETSYKYPAVRHLIALVGNWGFALFYIMSELWGTFGLSVLFWQIANEITRVNEAKRVYPLFGLVANFGVILAGQLLIFLTKMTEHLSDGDRWAKSLKWIIVCLLVSFMLIIYLHSYINRCVVTDPTLYEPQEAGASLKKNKVKLSFSESMKIVFSYKYLGLLSILLLGHGMTINFIDATFKNQLKVLYANPADMTKFIGWYSSWTGICAVILMIVGANLTRRFSWKNLCSYHPFGSPCCRIYIICFSVFL